MYSVIHSGSSVNRLPEASFERGLINRVVRSEIATYSLVVDAKDESALHFYQYHGFMALLSSLFTLFLPFATEKKLLL